jgi:hypothetical protein
MRTLALWPINKSKSGNGALAFTEKRRNFTLLVNKYMKKKLSKFRHVQSGRDDGVVDFAHLANLYVSFGAYA